MSRFVTKKKIIPLAGPGVSASCYRMIRRLGRVEPMRSEKVVRFVVKDADTTGRSEERDADETEHRA